MPPPDDDNKPLLLKDVIRVKDSIAERLASNEKSSWTIDMVPRNWRDVHENAFLPEMIRIGPFRDENERKHQHRLGVMEQHKLRFLNRLLGGELERLRRPTRRRILAFDLGVREDDDGDRVEEALPLDDLSEALCLDDLLKAMHILEPKTRAFYSKNFFPFYSDFREMMVVDGCFVVELLRLYYDLLHTKSTADAIKDDPILANPRILTTLRRDLLLLENQLPFFVLEKLYELINKKNNIDHQQAVRLEVLAVTFFNPLLPQKNAASKLDSKSPKDHLLDVFRSTFLKSVSGKVHNKGKDQADSQLNRDGSIRGLSLHFPSELEEAGVQFKKWKGHDLLDIEFRHGTLRVPPFSINENTVSLLLNFVAYELSMDHREPFTDYHREPFFTNYLLFWDSLVNSPGDIQILHKHGIINNALGSDVDVANLLMRCRQVISDRDLGYLHYIIEGVNGYCEQYCESKRRVWWRSLIRERFSSPWTCLSLFAAIILLLLTLLQTFYTVYAYYRPH
ncbi:hypothetical protein BT93_F2704 [Corymbia citriodora subsp. variegata]|nr:hypothetical protein BT93_F2704 [Corymbia citriodora subsp. variegata]